MGFSTRGDEVKDSHGQTVAVIKPGEIRNSKGQTICKMRKNQVGTEFVDAKGHTFGKLKDSGDVVDDSSRTVCKLRDAKASFPHADDRASAALYLLFAA